ncbi:MAG: hypothetical protein GY894_08290 [Planctomycetes bacterium]|nr:hypothetical protein [Planctomycetota bacterium]MCP4839345.1 hypothetical protein [Planctomycetota bacterium]
MAKKTTRKASATPKKKTSKAPARRKTTAKKVTKKKASPAKKASAKKKVAKKKASTAKKASAKKKVTPKKASTAKPKPAPPKPTKKKTKRKASTPRTAPPKRAIGEGKQTAPTGRRRTRRTVLEAAMSAEADRNGYVIINGRRVRRISVDEERTTKRKKKSGTAATGSKKKTRKAAKSRLTAEDLKQFRELLLSKRREVLSALDAMETEALRTDSGETSNMPIHMADVGSDAYEQDLKLGISASERERIVEIDAALQRIVDGNYGICELSGKAIRKARLRAKPWARMTIDTAREQESLGRKR